MRPTTPDRSLQQRLDALQLANTVRTYRAQLKVDIAEAREDADAVLVSGDRLVDTMKVEELLLAVPGIGHVKVNQVFRRYGISPSKTIGGLSPRQRAQLLVVLRSHRARSNLYAARKVAHAA
jgi:hypothetical protein